MTEQATSWREIESAPKDRTILLWDSRWGLQFGEWAESLKAWVDSDAEVTTPTHWMPLPAPPDGQRARPDGYREDSD
jgi:hypothetical protein